MQAVQYKCPNCGGDITYNADSGLFTCEYCNGTYTIQQVISAHKRNESIDLTDKEKQERQTEFEENSALYNCPSCGSEIIADKNAVTLECYYCHSPVTLVGRLSGDYKPDYIIPFSVSKEKAEEIFLEFCKDKIYLPDDFKNGKVLEKITGVYVPFWLGDYSFDTRVIATCRRHEKLSGNRTKVKEYRADRGAVIYYDNVPADGARLMDNELLDALQPYDYNALQNFTMSYLSGFMAEKYDVGAEEALLQQEERARQHCPKSVEAHLKSSYNYASTNQAIVERQSVNYKYALLPVWFLAYNYNGKIYQYGVNGQTGKVSGSIPIDKKKLNLRSLLYSIFGAVFGFGIGMMIIGLLS